MEHITNCIRVLHNEGYALHYFPFVLDHFLSAEKTENCKIKQVQSDWCSEFHPFTNYLAYHGIVHRLICPHTHHQNGVIERKHRHIVELGLTLLHQASLPLHFWDYAFTTHYILLHQSSSISYQ